MEKEKVLECLIESIKMAMNGDCDMRITIRNGDIEVLYALGKEAETDERENTETVSSGTEEEGD